MRVEQEKQETEVQLSTRLQHLASEMADKEARMAETHSFEIMELKRTHTFRLQHLRDVALSKLAGASCFISPCVGVVLGVTDDCTRSSNTGVDGVMCACVCWLLFLAVGFPKHKHCLGSPLLLMM